MSGFQDFDVGISIPSVLGRQTQKKPIGLGAFCYAFPFLGAVGTNPTLFFSFFLIIFIFFP